MAADELDARDEAVDQRALVGEREGVGDEFEALGEEGLAAGAVAVVEGFEGGGFGLLEGLEAGPPEEKVGGQGTPELVATQLERLGKVLFEKGLEAIGESGAFVDDGAAVEDGLLESPGLGVLRAPGFEFVVVGEEQLGQVLGVLGVIFGATGDEGTSGG